MQKAQNKIEIIDGISMLAVLSGILMNFLPDTNDHALPVFFGGIGMLSFKFAFPRLCGVKVGDYSVSFTEEHKKEIASDVVNQLGQQIESIANDGMRLHNHKVAFSDVLRIVSDYINNAQEPSAEIQLRLIAVSMCFSWRFINDDLVPFVRSHRDTNFLIRIAIIQPEYLSQFDLDTKKFNWAEFSHNLPAEITLLEQRLRTEGITNLTIETFYYEGFPQYHGVLINGEHLYLGITDWDTETESGKPRLTVGDNEYRYFNTTSKTGKSRIKLFRHWFTFCCKYKNIKSLPLIPRREQ